MLRVLMQTAPALSYTLALSGVKFRDYLIGSLVGLPLPIASYCIFLIIWHVRRTSWGAKSEDGMTYKKRKISVVAQADLTE